MNLVLIGVVVFIAAALYDVAFARFLSSRGRHQAARWSTATYMIGLVGTVGLLKVNTWLAIPEIAGLYLGTFLGWRPRCECTCDRCGR